MQSNHAHLILSFTNLGFPHQTIDCLVQKTRVCFAHSQEMTQSEARHTHPLLHTCEERDSTTTNVTRNQNRHLIIYQKRLQKFINNL